MHRLSTALDGALRGAFLRNITMCYNPGFARGGPIERITLASSEPREAFEEPWSAHRRGRTGGFSCRFRALLLRVIVPLTDRREILNIRHLCSTMDLLSLAWFETVGFVCVARHVLGMGRRWRLRGGPERVVTRLDGDTL